MLSTSSSGVSQSLSTATHEQVQEIEGVLVPVIALDDLKVNNRASGRAKDLDDLENLP